MTYIPWHVDWNHPSGQGDGIGSSHTITVLPLSENKRPVGFAEWPKGKRKRKKSKRKSAA